MYHGRVVYLPQVHYQAKNLDEKYPLSSQLQDELQYTSDGYPLDENPCWNRCLLSHHCSFLVWSLAIHGLYQQNFGQTAQYLSVYDEILTYTRIIDPTDYDTHVRPIMATFWPGFSAVWSYEFQLLKSLMKSLPKSKACQAVHEAFKACHLNHLATAKALVPTGRSLLQEIKRAGKQQVSSAQSLNFAYDCLFLIQRKQVSVQDLELQVLAKFAALIDDNGQQRTCDMVSTCALVDSLKRKWLS